LKEKSITGNLYKEIWKPCDVLCIRNNYLRASFKRGEKRNAIMAISLAYSACKKISYWRTKSCFGFQASNTDEGIHLRIIRHYNLRDELRVDGVYLILSWRSEGMRPFPRHILVEADVLGSWKLLSPRAKVPPSRPRYLPL